MTETEELRRKLLDAGKESVKQLIQVAEEDITKRFKIKKKSDESEEQFIDRYQAAMDKLKQVASTKRMAIFDAFEILEKVENEEASLKEPEEEEKNLGSFAERRAK